jgi:6-phosphogluconolactonase
LDVQVLTASDEHRFANARELACELAKEIAAQLASALQVRATASLVVSGGTTPIPMFRHLSQIKLDWARVQVTLVDERWVDPADQASNERLVRSTLLQGFAAAAQFIPLKNAAETPQLGAADAWSALKRIPSPFDVVVLGMGEDGHSASWFPESPGLLVALDLHMPPACVAMWAPVAPHQRLSLNLAAIAATRQLFLHFTGQRKWEVYQAATADAKVRAPLPISAVLRLPKLRPQLYWSA